MKNQTWLIKTGQSWKFYVFFILNLVVVALFLSPSDYGLIASIQLFASWIWFCNSIKCPDTGYKPVWPLVKSVPFYKWHIILMDAEECPRPPFENKKKK